VLWFGGAVEGVMFNSSATPARLKRVLLWPEPPRALGLYYDIDTTSSIDPSACISHICDLIGASGSYILSLLSKEILVHKLKTNRGIVHCCFLLCVCIMMIMINN
jgi:hypothetical protein